MLVTGTPAHRVVHHSTKVLAIIWNSISLGGNVSRYVRTENRADTFVWTLSIFHKENRLEEMQYSNLCNGFLSFAHTFKSVVMDLFSLGIFTVVYWESFISAAYKPVIQHFTGNAVYELVKRTRYQIHFNDNNAIEMIWYVFVDGNLFCVNGMFWYTCKYVILKSIF